MRCKLASIAEIRQGLALRAKVEHDPAGPSCLVQARDLTENGRIDAGSVFRVKALQFKAEQRLRPGDVLLQPRGVNYPVAWVEAELRGAIAAAPLYVIRAQVDRVDPTYLVAFLSNPLTQAQLRSRATGTYVPQLVRAEIEDLEIPLPPLDDQRRFVELAVLARRERALNDRLAELRSQVLWGLMRQTAENETQGRSNAPGL